MSEDEKPEQIGKQPGEGAQPAEQNPLDNPGAAPDSDGSEAVGDGPSGGAVEGGETTDSEAIGSGPSGGADS